MSTQGRHRNPSTAGNWARIVAFVFLPVAAAVVTYGLRLHFGWLLSAYGLLAFGRAIAQSAMAAAVRRRTHRLTGQPVVSIVVAVLNEPIGAFDRAMASLARQNWPAYEVIVVDDGSDNPDANRAVCERYGLRYVWQPNAGKRHALHRAFGMLHSQSRYVLTGDSDTVWHPDATARLVAGLQSGVDVGAVTGHVGTLNPRVNWLTRLTALRYWVAFEVERAAQGFFGVVTCVSGPLGGYRRDLIDRIKGDFIAQRFMGKPCTFGDDRHLTNLTLLAGYRVVYTRAEAWTEVPSGLRQYLRQQTRWGKSHWRELLWTWRALPKHPLYLAYDWALTLLLPFLLVASVGRYVVAAAGGHPRQVLVFLAAVILMGLVRAVPAVVSTRRPEFLLLAVFSLFHLVVLLPLKFVSLVTVARGTWGTRKASRHSVEVTAVTA